MKKVIYFSLFLLVAAGMVAILTGSSPDDDKKKTKKKKEVPQKTMKALLRDTTNCANYYEAVVAYEILPHSNTCPPGCTEIHAKQEVLEKTLKTCPKGKIFNARTLACDFPENVKTCPHTPKCTND